MHRGDTSKAPHRAPTPDDAGRETAETVLLRACLAGQQGAWNQLVRKYERLVYAIPRRMGLPNDLVEDTFQEVFAILFRSLPSLQHGAALPQWLVTTTRRVALRLVQKQRKGDLLRPAPEDSDPREESERWERIAAVSEALELLEPGCRDLLMALTRDSVTSYSEIANQLGVPIGSIGPRRARCLAKLLKHLRAVGGSDFSAELPRE